MTTAFNERRGTTLLRLIAIAVIPTTTACAKPGTYELSLAPSPVAQFHSVHVTPVTTGVTNDSLDITVPVMLRNAIIETLRESGRYQRVEAELEPAPGVLRIDCRISEFDAGSRGGRWLAGGLGVGRGHLDATCQFFDMADEGLYAEGVFSDEIKGGFFGGGVNLEDMSSNMAAALDRFLEDGRQ